MADERSNVESTPTHAQLLCHGDWRILPMSAWTRIYDKFETDPDTEEVEEVPQTKKVVLDETRSKDAKPDEPESFDEFLRSFSSKMHQASNN